MPKVLFEQLEFYHTLLSKSVNNGSVLVILDYDYFLQKGDFKLLLKKYEKVFLIPLEQSIKLSSEIFLQKNLIKTYNQITIINNPAYQQYFGNSIELKFDKDIQIMVLNVFDFCEKILKKCYVADNIAVINPNLTSLRYFGLIPRILKKIIDWLGGISIYLLTQPLWLISAVKINIESPGPIFFKQDRIGIRNTEFNVFKFRSMRIDAEANGAQFCKKNDDRVFPWGKTMRSTRIDELPQLFNIIKGELSLVGPRPERFIFTESFEEIIPQYNQRHNVKPGISGYAQIMYPYGTGVKDARHKLMYDLYYIKNWNLKLELTILLKTVIIVLTKKGF